MTFPELGVCGNCGHGEHGRCSAMTRDVTCTCIDRRCVADRARIRHIEGVAADARDARKVQTKRRYGGLSDKGETQTTPNDPRIAAHETTEVVSIHKEPPVPTLTEPTDADLDAIENEMAELGEEVAPLVPDRLDVPWHALAKRPGEWVDLGVLELRAFTVDGRIVVRARVLPREVAA